VNGGRALSSLAGLRLAIGAGAWTIPRLTGSLFGLDADGNPQSPYLARLFGVRDVALGWGVITSGGDARRRWVLAGIGCDLADAAAGVLATRGGYLPKPAGVLVTGTALAAAGLGAAALLEG
jgi:hypothetical protein